jgi:hypothetical protein
VRQRLVDDSPVVETLVRVPGGDVVHRTWAVASGPGVPNGGAVVVELENASPVPVAVAFAIRPFGPLGRVPVTAITLDGSVVSVDGRPALVLPKAPSRVAVGSAAVDSVVPTVAGDAAATWPDGGARCSAGRASAALLFPLPHTATVRVVLPLVAAKPGVARRRAAEPEPELDPRRAPDAERVAAGWATLVDRAPRLEVPESRVPDVLAAARAFLLLHAAGDDVGAWPPAVIGGLDTAEACLALDQHGYHAEAARLLVGFADRQGLDGSFAGESSRADAGAAWLHALAHHVRLSGDAELAEALVGPVAKAAHHLRRRTSPRRARRAEGPAGVVVPGPSAPWVPPGDPDALHDALWVRRGLLDAALLLDVAGQPDAAREPRATAEEVDAAVSAALRSSLGPAGAGAVAGASVLATLVASAATLVGPEPAPELVGAIGQLLAVAPDTVRGGVWHEVGDAGLSPRLTAWLGSARLAVADPAAFEQLAWLLEVGDPVWSWPELVHPRSGGGCAGEGHHAPSTAAVLQLLRRLVVHEAGGDLALLPAVPESWFGQPVEAHDVPTSHGRLSFAVRWHGDRPALLWELDDTHPAAVVDAVRAVAPFRLTAPGLDPSWSSTDARGDALLAAPRPVPVAPDEPVGPVAPAPEQPVDPDEPGGGSFS